MTILKTRLFKPHVQNGFLIRPRLLEKFIQNQYKPVTLVVAPAGYGKSVAVSQWLDKIKTNYSWISLDNDCNELKQFLKLFCTAIVPYINKNDDLCENLIEATQLPNLENIAKYIVNSIAGIQAEHIIVFDDYHLINNPDVHFLMQILAENINQKHIITFIGRFDQSLNLNNLKSYDLVNEIRLVDLKFSSEDISELSDRVFLYPLDKEISSVIFRSTEGWIVPTRLILKNIAQNKLDPYSLKNMATDKLELTFEFLEYTFGQSDVEIQECMMIASLFKRFSVSLLSEIFNKLYPDKKQESKHLKKRIETFISHALFIIPLDTNKNWYRFHDLIRDFLNKRIYSSFSPDKINSAFITGSQFFEDNHSFEEAIQLAVKGGDMPLAVAIIEKNRLRFLNQQLLDILEHWLSYIPAGVAENYPLLLLTRASIYEKKGLFEKMEEDLERAKNLMSQLDERDVRSQAHWGEYYSLQSTIDFLKGNLNIGMTNSEKAMQLLNHESTFLYYFTMLYRIFALNALGKSTEALDLLMQDKKISKAIHKKTPVENHLLHTMHLMVNGHLNRYDHEAKLARNIAKDESHKVIFVLANYYLALSSYLRNELEEALSYINEALITKYFGRPFWTLVCYQLKAFCLLALKDIEEYQRCIVEATDFVKNFNTPYYNNLLEIMKIEFRLYKGDVKMNEKRFKNLDFRTGDFVHVYFKPSLTEVKLLLATNKKQNIEQAEILIKQYMKTAHSTYNQNLLLQLNCLNILLLLKQNKTNSAIEQFRTLLAETKTTGLIRLYTDMGYAMKKLFDQLTNHEKNEVYTNQILQSFDQNYPNDHTFNKQLSENNFEPDLNNKEYEIGKITVRDIKLLNLLNEELHNKEIAILLNITTDSVKKSLYRLYKKLNVNRRSEAIQKAFDLNLIQIHSRQN